MVERDVGTEEKAKALQSRLEARSEEFRNMRANQQDKKSGDLEDAPEVEKMAKELIKAVQEHNHLANAKIRYAYKNKDSWESKGKTVFAKAVKLSPREQFLSGFDLMVIVNKKIWAQADNAKRLCILDHELCHFEINMEKQTWSVRPHDVEDFITVVSRRGAWTKALTRMIEVGSKQLNLFEEAS